VVDIKVGQHRYAEDENTGIWCAAYQFDDEPVRHWRLNFEPPYDLRCHVQDDLPVVSHNAGFERAIWNAKFPAWPLKIEQQSCTMARAVSMGLPASLEALAVALRTNVTKDKEGRALMMRMCRPKKIHEDGTIEWHDTKDLPRLVEYCVQDVRTEAAIDKLLPELTPEERKVWELDQHINDRGVQIDVPMVTAATACAKELLKRANKKIWLLTDGYVKRVTEAAKICEWIRSRGIPCESIAEGEHEGLIVCADMFDDPVIEEVIRLRAASAKAFKFPAMLNAKCKDGRVRDSLKYGATVQGRWAGSGVQFHNMKRVDTDADANDVGLAVDIVRNSDIRDIARTVDRLEALFDSPLETLSLCTRASVIAAPGHRLLGGDFSNIEGRLNAWFAGEAWKLDAFRAYDAGTGPDLYKVTAGRIIGCGPDQVTKAQRQEQGKVPELACMGRDTRVLTDQGIKAITDVELSDLLWDGEEWVSHGGLIDRGKKPVMMLSGVLMTPDHQVLCGGQWQQARTVAFNPGWRARAQATGLDSLLSLHMWRHLRAVLKQSWSYVTADQDPTKSIYPISEADEAHVAIHAQSALRDRLQSSGPDTQEWSQTIRIDAASATEYPPVTIAAITLRTLAIQIMEAGVFMFTSLGGAIEQLFSATWSALKAGTMPLLNWTEGTWIKATSPATSASSLTRAIRRTAEKLAFYKPGSQSLRRVYDIADAGPRNRFTIITDDGPLIVHNCGYQGAAGAFRKMGAKYGVRLTDEIVKRIVAQWRGENPKIVESWRILQDAAIEAVSAQGCVVSCLDGKVAYVSNGDFLFCRLPSGRVISYASPSVAWKTKVVVIDGDEIEFNRRTVSFWGMQKGWRQIDLYGGMQCAHVVSGAARDVLVSAMFRLERAGYPLVLTVHDECLSEAPIGFGSADEYREILMEKDSWFAEVPIAATAWEGPRYVK
jgi:DNA polymerase